MTLKIVLGMLFLLTGCASAGQSSECPYKSLIGQNAYNENVSKLRDGGKTIRLLYPESYLGFKADPNRINLIRDEDDRIQAVTCG